MVRGTLGSCVDGGTVFNMSQAHSSPLNLRISPDIRDRLDVQGTRYDLTITSVSRIALVIGLETLERLRGQAPQALEDPGPTGE